MITYLGKPELKAQFLEQIAWHETQDALVKGTYGRMNGQFKGCAIGCSVHSLNRLQGKTGADLTANTGRHQRLEDDLGWPLWLAHLEDTLFEALPDNLSRTWPRRLSEAVPVGVEIPDRVLARMLWWTLAADTYGVKHAADDAEVRGWIDTIAAMLAAEAAGTCTADQREAAARAAWAARAARDESIRDGFYPALSEFVLSELRALTPA